MAVSKAGQVEKARLRDKMRLQLTKLDARAARRAADAMADRLLDLPAVRDAERVFTCLAFGTEIETRGRIARLLDSGRQVFVPRTVRRGRRLTLHAYPCRLERRPFGLEEPVADAPVLAEAAIDSTIQVALILGLAFDRRCFRLGYGGGYFDRFLNGRPFPAVGMAYDAQCIHQLPVELHDVPMDFVVSPTRTLVRRDAANGTLGP